MPLGVSLEIRPDQVRNDRGIDFLGAEGFDQHADRFRDADGVRQLHLALVGEAGSDDVLRNVAAPCTPPSGRPSSDPCR